MRIGLISCTKSKTTYPAPARDLYAPSALFRGALNYLESQTDVTYVLSAKYGLLPLDQVAEPYDQTLKDATPTYRREWARKVAQELQLRHGPSLAGITFEVHAGEAYGSDLLPLLKAAGATCVSPVEGMTIGERLHFYGSQGEHRPEYSHVAPAHMTAPPDRITGLKIHVEVWLAAALLHEAGLPEFSGARLAKEVEQRFGDTRSGVTTHIHAHCVANAPKNTTVEYSYLYRTDSGHYRLLRPGDQLHPTRSGRRTAPDQADVPDAYWPLWRKMQSGDTVAAGQPAPVVTPGRGTKDLEPLAAALRERNRIDREISALIGRPAHAGHIAEYIAAQIFDIELNESASAKGTDGRFRSGALRDRTVNIKYKSSNDSLLDINPAALADFYLVMTGPIRPAMTSRGTSAPWVVSHLYLFEATRLLGHLLSRSVKVGIATSVAQAYWQEAELFPAQRSSLLALTEVHRNQLLLFADTPQAK